ncbi:unnamed protein product [Arabidopsis lyrata]|uniref:HTH La-type RNA-binding domain-containing protein n=1 Tax=Arabidopsis lyrata subsp. lyrata TaxID=81972 RepID=D7KT85_ARALL|nr:la-related protein 1B [Arabidopsis lyrata subsp. lyrata]EFH65308.1 hypothetical protein ARALYDRAFT_895473 [Arabidopsis lyrata subsp. lyrata]CAH8258304.1 unnamed protein product [Arabidopsis lyrata]|eukprot:XP_002889049.1 la-related protein 1B [Arabidopsis lyrata subsp. lyrata]
MSNYPRPFSITPWFPLPQFSYRPVFDLAHLPELRRLALDSNLSSFMVFQIDYYFSDENLAKDNYLRSQMDNQGWVNIFIIAEFPRIKSMTNDIEFILRSMRSSATVEIQNHKLRKRYGWQRWIQ